VVFCEEVFAATKSLFIVQTQRSEYFLIKKSFLRALRGSAVNSPLIP
jgi:hypothetical protein